MPKATFVELHWTGQEARNIITSSKMSLSSHPPGHQDHDIEKENFEEKKTVSAIAGLPLVEDAIRNGSVNPETILKHAVDGDEALKAFANYQGSIIHIDEATNKRLLRKIDINLMPVCLEFLFCDFWEKLG